jgi:hypothetical protein
MIAPATQKLLTYPSQVPLIYANSSLMSPDRRALYLGHPKSGTRKVHPIKSEQIPSLTTDPRMPIDLCCVHTSDNLEHTYVFFSSKMINVAKVKEERDDLGRLGAVAAKAIADRPFKIEQDQLKNLPRKKATRQQTGYDRIPVSREGKLLLDSQHYPKLPESEKTLYSLDTAMWYVWFAILSEYGDNFSSVAEWEQEPYFVVQNPYHIIAQAL